MDDPGTRPRGEPGAGGAPRAGGRLPAPGPAPEPGWAPADLAEVHLERDQLRIALQMVLDFGVFDGAGRAVTVEDALRGYVATAVRVALQRGRPKP